MTLKFCINVLSILSILYGRKFDEEFNLTVDVHYTDHQTNIGQREFLGHYAKWRAQIKFSYVFLKCNLEAFCR